MELEQHIVCVLALYRTVIWITASVRWDFHGIVSEMVFARSLGDVMVLVAD